MLRFNLNPSATFPTAEPLLVTVNASAAGTVPHLRAVQTVGHRTTARLENVLNVMNNYGLGSLERETDVSQVFRDREEGIKSNIDGVMLQLRSLWPWLRHVVVRSKNGAVNATLAEATRWAAPQ